MLVVIPGKHKHKNTHSVSRHLDNWGSSKKLFRPLVPSSVLQVLLQELLIFVVLSHE